MPDAVTQPAPRSQPASQPERPSQPEAHQSGPGAARRLAWLDALRGIAALCVVFDHLTYSVLQPLRNSVYHWFDPGQYGVFVFFLVSGYIVPASLERKGSVRGFWVSRVFRLYPIYLFAVGAMIVLWATGIGSLSGMNSDAVTSSFADVFMLQSVLWAPTLPNVVWSLAYEMVFYLLLTALFLSGAHRRSSRYALVFGVAAVALGGVLRPGSLSHHLLTPGVVVALTDGLLFLGLTLALASRGRWRTYGAALAAATGLLVIMFNSGYAAPWESFTIFALMFTGTALYRAESGEYPWRRARYVVILVFGVVLVAVQWHISPEAESFVAIRKGFNSLEFAGLTFALAMLCRDKKLPRALAWLGLVSYSVYLLHPVLIEVYASVPWTQNENFVPMELLMVAVFVLVLLVCCALTHRFIEAPMQRLVGGPRAASTPGSDRTCRSLVPLSLSQPVSSRGCPGTLPTAPVAVETLDESYRSYASNHWRQYLDVPRRRRHAERSRVHRRFTDKSDYGPSFPAVNALITLSTKAIGEMASANQDISTA